MKNNIKVVYKYNTDISEEESKRRLEKAFDIIFIETLRLMKEEESKTNKHIC